MTAEETKLIQQFKEAISAMEVSVCKMNGMINAFKGSIAVVESGVLTPEEVKMLLEDSKVTVEPTTGLLEASNASKH